MPKNRHHFVPRFYLSAFQSAPKRIHLLGIDPLRTIPDVGIREQCYRHKFYGKTDEVEDALGKMEDETARVLRAIETEGLPPEDSDEHAALLAFVAFQWLRTARVADRVSTLIEKQSRQIRSNLTSDEEAEWLRLPSDNPVLVALKSVGYAIAAISDLTCHLVVPEGGKFITCDHPVFSYNQYCEGITYQGTTGALCCGLQIFMPLSPRSLLVFFDKKAYKIVRAERRPHRSIASLADVAILNSMQLVSASQNAFFSDWQARDDLQRLLSAVSAHRATDPIVVQEYGHDTEPNRSLLHSFERAPDLKLNLSFLKVRWDARSIPLAKRAQGYRKAMPIPELPELPLHLRGPATFSRFMGRQ